jgi:perosamine synthetase
MSNLQPFEQMERDWAEFNQLDPAGMVACSSGTAALHLALEAMRLPQGSEVIVPDLTMIAVPRAVTLAGLTPVFVDCDDTLNMDPKLLRNQGAAKTGKYLSAMVVVHTYGVQARREEINFETGTYDCRFIEDLAEAHGLTPHHNTDAACWSFYKNKIVAGEEGGAVWFRDKEHAALARQLRTLGFTDAHDFTHVPRGHNYRMSNAHAALVLDSLRRVVLSQENRWLQWHTYNELCPKDWRMLRPDAPWVYAMRIPGLVPLVQSIIIEWLKKEGIEARHCFKPSSYQEEYRQAKCVHHIPNMCGRMVQEVIYLPLSSYHTRCNLDAFNLIQRILDN